MDWRHRALCRDEDPELFFPIGTTGPALVQIEQAKAVCQRCPVVQSCLDWALRSGQDSGVWGGLSEDERRALKRRQARTRVHTACRDDCARISDRTDRPEAGPGFPDRPRRFTGGSFLLPAVRARPRCRPDRAGCPWSGSRPAR